MSRLLLRGAGQQLCPARREPVVMGCRVVCHIDNSLVDLRLDFIFGLPGVEVRVSAEAEERCLCDGKESFWG